MASLLKFDFHRERRAVLVDPCAGDGEAIAGLRDIWTPAHYWGRILAVEMEKVRAAGHAKHLELEAGSFDLSVRADAFHVEIDAKGGASLLFLNPPYDFDKEHGRLEQRFLERWTQALEPGFGVLMFLVPHYALKASAAFLSCQFEEVRAWRFPAEHFDAFKQCVLLARRRGTPVPTNEMVQKRIERWSADASLLPELAVAGKPALVVEVGSPGLDLAPVALDLHGLRGAFRPWGPSAFVGLDRGVRDMIGAKFNVAQPPRPAHIALALSVGMLDGKRLTPNRPGLPPILVKGSFTREFIEVEERFNKHGEKTGSVRVQRPRLTINVLRLDTRKFLELRPGTTPSGAANVEDFNSADLVEQYSESLGRLMREQFPALHDPTNPAHDMDLADLTASLPAERRRRPYRVQKAAILAGLKLIASGENPQVVAEVGTGKSTVSLWIAGSLSPQHHAQTARDLAAIGIDSSRLPKVRRTLILCPPHLLKSWRDQAAAVLPEHRVVIVERISDLHQPGDIFVMSREVAKLAHGVAGIGDMVPRPDRLPGAKTWDGPPPVWRHCCPRCGTRPPFAPDAIASGRLTCPHVDRVPQNEWAHLAEDLAAALVWTYPFDPHVRSLARRRRILARALPQLTEETEIEEEDQDSDAEPQAGPLPRAARLRPLAERLSRVVTGSDYPDYRAKDAFTNICLAAGLAQEIASELERKAAAAQALSDAAKARGLGPYTSEVFDPGHHAERLRDRARKLREAQEPKSGAGSSKPLLIEALHNLVSLGTWEQGEPCGERLFHAIPEPRRYPLSRYILRHLRGHFDLLILDEAHEFSTKGSAQQKAAHRLVEMPGVPTISLTGSLMGGYAGSLFANFWALSRHFRQQFRPTEQQAFITRYGYRKVFVPVGADSGTAEVVSFGSRSDREQLREAPEVRQMGQSPGVLPLFILEHLLRVACIMHKEDLDQELPPCREIPIPVSVDELDEDGKALLKEFERLLSELTRRIQADRFSSDAGKLWGAMSELPSYLDRCTDDLAEFVLQYPNGVPVAKAKQFPAAWMTPKERCIVDRVRQHLADGLNVLVFLRHTGKSGLPGRYQRLFEKHLGEKAIFLDVNKVKAAHREDWLNQQVIERGRRILITHPRAVQTGLNNLVHFSRAIWVEGVDYDARVVRQANGRVHRIGQTRDVEIEVPYYEGTVQKTALDLVARKISASVLVDGSSIEGALESAGAGDGEDEANQAAMGMGQAIYEAWINL